MPPSPFLSLLGAPPSFYLPFSSFWVPSLPPSPPPLWCALLPPLHTFWVPPPFGCSSTPLLPFGCPLLPLPPSLTLWVLPLPLLPFGCSSSPCGCSYVLSAQTVRDGIQQILDKNQQNCNDSFSSLWIVSDKRVRKTMIARVVSMRCSFRHKAHK